MRSLSSNHQEICDFIKSKLDVDVCPKNIKFVGEFKKVVENSSLNPSFFDNVILLGQAAI